jgi:hypothetical protein
LDGWLGQSSKVKHVLANIRRALTEAETALYAGDIDGGWKHLHTAKRLELLALSHAHLNAVAIAMRAEAEKLSEWRKKTVLELLDECKKPDRSKVCEAALLRDEHYGNEAYKNGVRRSGILWLALALLLGMFALLWLAWSQALLLTIRDPSISSCISLSSVLLSVAVFGLLGATFSAITKAQLPRGSSRIPEVVFSFRVTILRLMVGPVSAIIVYLGTQSVVDGKVLAGKPGGYTILIIAFAAGFTERLVLRVVEAVAGKASS